MKKILFILTIIVGFTMHVSAVDYRVQLTNINDVIITRNEEVLKLKKISSERDEMIYNYNSTRLEIPYWEELSFFPQQGNYVLNLSEEEWMRVEALIYYGYGYQDHMDMKWYVVTQYMLWNLLEPDNTWSITDANDPNNHYESEILELTSLVERHLTWPSFAKDFIVLKEGEETFLHDENGVLKDWIGYGSEGICYEEKDGGILLSDCSEEWMMDREKYVSISKHGNVGYYMRVYMSPRYKLIARGEFNDIERHIPVYIGGSSILLEKGNKDAIYRVKNEIGDVVDYIHVGEESRLLPYGKYYISLESSPSHIIDDHIYEIELINGIENVRIEVKQEDQNIVEIPKDDPIPETPKDEMKPEVPEIPTLPKEELVPEEDIIIKDLIVVPSKEEEKLMENIIVPEIKPIQNPINVRPSKDEMIEKVEPITEDTMMKEVLDEQPIVEEKKDEIEENHSKVIYVVIGISVVFMAYILKKCMTKK